MFYVIVVADNCRWVWAFDSTVLEKLVRSVRNPEVGGCPEEMV